MPRSGSVGSSVWDERTLNSAGTFDRRERFGSSQTIWFRRIPPSNIDV
jgi:hypothetical protein